VTRGVNLDVAGVVMQITLPEESWAEDATARYAAFASDAPAQWRVAVREDPGQPSVEPGWAQHEGQVTHFHIYQYHGAIDLAARTAWVTAPVRRRLASALERTLTYILMQALPRDHEALLLHACGVQLEGRGHVFFGPSGAGKTTVARLAHGHADVFCDENVVLKLTRHGVELWSTPFWGASTPIGLIHRAARRAPLAGLFRLVHDPRFALTPLAPGPGVAALLESEKVATERVESALAWLAVAGKIVERVPVHTLAFAPTPELWPFLMRHESNSAA
jgi:hypothetical protein